MLEMRAIGAVGWQTDHPNQASKRMAKATIQNQKEIWKPLPSCPMYLVSNHGQVASTYGVKTRIMKQQITPSGYLRLSLVFHPTTRTQRVHRLVAEAFGLDCSQTIDHIDGNKENNALVNLRSCSITQNLFYARGKPMKLRGASYKADRGYWCAMAGRKYGQKYLGKFDTAEKAAAAVRKFERAADREAQ